ncbi:hypothetical protein, partial [Parvibaculum sp.]
ANDEGACVFVTIGPGETRITILDEEGNCERSWAAIYGWSSLCSIPLEADGKEFPIDDERLMARALTGSVIAYGRNMDTATFVTKAAAAIEIALDEILSGTVGSGASYSAIVLAAPVWMHGLLENSVDIRPHILREIREA